MSVKTGSVISGTLKESDLVPAFMGCLDGAAYGRIHAEHGGILDGDCLIADECELTESEDEELHWLMESLFDCLNEIAPAGHYFGAHEGDGSDFGFWSIAE